MNVNRNQQGLGAATRAGCAVAAVLMSVLLMGSQLGLANFYGGGARAALAAGQEAGLPTAQKHAAVAGSAG